MTQWKSKNGVVIGDYLNHKQKLPITHLLTILMNFETYAPTRDQPTWLIKSVFSEGYTTYCEAGGLEENENDTELTVPDSKCLYLK
jgi:hypothetical protein